MRSSQYESLTEAAERMVRVSATVALDPSKKDVYDFHCDKYVASYPGLKGLMHEVSARTEGLD